MPNLTVTLTDQQGRPLPGVILQNGQYNTTPCPWDAIGCTTGPGNPIEGTTDENGQCAFNIPYTCQGEWSGNWYANGFDLLPWDTKTGPVTGPIGITLVMVANQGAPGNTPKGNPNEGSLADQLAADLEGGNPGGKSIMDWLSTYWWVPVLAVILIVILILAFRHRSGAVKLPAINPTTNVSAVGA